MRVLTRLVGRLRAQVPDLPVGFVNRTRSARRRMQEIQRLTPTQRQDQQVPKYRALVTIATAVVQGARAVVAAAETLPGAEPVAAAQGAALRAEIGAYCDRTERVLEQARRRILEGASVPTAEKLFSIFEPHTDFIKRGKAQKPVEFGHKVFLAESGRGLITDYRVLDGNPVDETQVAPGLERHRELLATPLDPRRDGPGLLQSSGRAGVRGRGGRRGVHPPAASARAPSGRPTKRAGRFARASGFAPASRGASRCCSAGAA